MTFVKRAFRFVITRMTSGRNIVLFGIVILAFIASKAAIIQKLLRSLVLVAKSFPFYIIIFFLGRPLVRLGFAYFYCAFIHWLLVDAPFVDISVMNSISDSLAVNSGSSADSNSINNNPPLDEAPFNPLPMEDAAPFHNNNVIPLDVVDQFRLLNQEAELELFARIRILENRLIEGLPPQMNSGEYEALVRGILDDTLTIKHYCNALRQEFFDITVLELKANLLEQLVNLLLSETPGRLTQILADSPFPEHAIRTEALEFINDFLTRLNLHEPRSPFDERLVEAMLRYWIQDAQQDGNLSAVYREFLRHFLGN